MEAHNGLSARIVEETGFEGIWASGLSMSAALGVRDNNEASWTQVLEVLEFMSDRTEIPILLDGDTGYGNFNNARRLIRKLETRGIAGVCLEDKLFPKTNSFIDSEKQPLADMDEFCGKIMACKDSQRDPDFNVIARLEAFITGWGIEEALKRASAYHKAGADAILVHSKKDDDSEIQLFMNEWRNTCPVVIVPTKYWKTPTQKFQDMGISLVIWANHNLRTSIHAMQATCEQIFADQSLANVETQIAPVGEIFRLQDAQELVLAEKKYLGPRPLDETERYFLSHSNFRKFLEKHGTTFFTGVPDSLLKDFCSYVDEAIPKNKHVIAANEGSAIAIASGYHFATGEIPCVYMQNSGLGNAINPLISLAHQKVYAVPILLLIGWRGEPGKKDEPQHIVQGDKTSAMLDNLDIPWSILPDFDKGAEEAVEAAYKKIKETGSPYAFLVKRQTFTKFQPKHQSPASRYPLVREEAIELIIDNSPDDAVFVATTGFGSRELFELREKKQQSHNRDFYTVGCMGHCSSIALGIALAQPHRRVYCLDGDGAMLMHMGNVGTIGLSEASNLSHIVLNNACHDSVGGQETGTFKMRLSDVAEGCGYHWCRTESTSENLVKALSKLPSVKGPSFLEIRLGGGTRTDLGRPTTTMQQNKEGFMEFLRTNKL
eukprot:CAMPEP_0174254056 /NCGR_PEP_ID=MMETSP0439-20130205/3403_1 /TAXON_ID=0 /ORGANISM="Stereomyxa ramosa, Strain Chinc5" /LENGTH=659 /DNA_ID=CAMNT_0015335425 /DNA_START=143 /DNA_END=2122 /DNA_ORIENTATION=-